MERIEITAIIVSYGHGATLGRALSSLQHLGDDLCEVIVVDNAGDLGETRLGTVCELVPDLFDPGENVGFSAAVNRVARGARGTVLMLLSPDAEIVRWDGERLVSDLDDNTGAIGALTLDDEGIPALSWGEFPGVRGLWRRLTRRRLKDRCKAFLSLVNGEPAAVDWVLGSAVAIPKPIFERADGLDEHYFSSGEDQDFGVRLAGLGLRVVVSPAWVVRHVPRDPQSMLPEIRNNNAKFIRQYGSRADRALWSMLGLSGQLSDFKGHKKGSNVQRAKTRG